MRKRARNRTILISLWVSGYGLLTLGSSCAADPQRLPQRYRTVVVTMRDADHAGRHAVVCDTDVQAVVRCVQRSGAKSVRLNKAAVTPRSVIQARGPALLCDGTALAPPFVIRAVGPKDRLVRALRELRRTRRFSEYRMFTFR